MTRRVTAEMVEMSVIFFFLLMGFLALGLPARAGVWWFAEDMGILPFSVYPVFFGANTFIV
jgi:hypothetical protein